MNSKTRSKIVIVKSLFARIRQNVVNNLTHKRAVLGGEYAKASR
jgi:hypothetical protein